MRLIDTDTLISNLEHTCYKFSADSPCHITAKSLIRLLEIQPTIDAVPVVRCKDCKHYVLHALACRNEHMNGVIAMNGFCSYGERRGKDAAD